MMHLTGPLVFFFSRAGEACRSPLFFACLLVSTKGTLNGHWNSFACIHYKPMVQQWLTECSVDERRFTLFSCNTCPRQKKGGRHQKLLVVNLMLSVS